MAQHATDYFIESADEAGDTAHVIVKTADNGRYYHLAYAEGVEFLLDTRDAVVWCMWDNALTREVAALYLLGPILGFVLRLRGITCLHASGILVDGRAIAIAGFSGAGKSTLAASFAAAGYPILTDDVLPVARINGETYAQPGYGRLRLLPHSFKNLPGIPNELPALAPGWEKCYLDLAAENFTTHGSPAPLDAIYILDWRSSERRSPSITPVSLALAVATLAAHTYRNELLSAALRRQEFYSLGAVAASARVCTLRPVDDINAIPLLRDMLLQDVEQEARHRQERSGRCAASGKDA